LLTGLYSHQAGVGYMTENSNQPGYQGQLHRNCVTIAEVLGYRLALSKNRGRVGIRGAKSWFFAGISLNVQDQTGLFNRPTYVGGLSCLPAVGMAIGVPGRIVVVLVAELTLYGFGTREGRFAELLSILEERCSRFCGVERIGIVAEFARLIWLRIFAGPIGGGRCCRICVTNLATSGAGPNGGPQLLPNLRDEFGYEVEGGSAGGLPLGCLA
jgi:hypothetical protein